MKKQLIQTTYLVIMACISLVVVGCQNDVYYHQTSNRHVVVLEGQRMSVLKLDDGSWEVAGGDVQSSENTQAFKDRQIKAIEIVSGCIVTESTQYLAQGNKPARLIAQVRCSQS
jgi:hypothetical protein